MFGEEELPKMPCQAVVSTDGKTPYFLYDRHRTGDFNFILWTPRGTNFNGRPDVMRYPLTILTIQKSSMNVKNQIQKLFKKNIFISII